MYAVTAASGQLGRLTLEALRTRIDPAQIVALVRDPAKLADIAASGVAVRAFDYDAPDTAALAGVERLLLISSNELGRRETQHRAVIDAAQTAGVGFTAYTSILHADDTPIGLALEHRATEAALAQSGIPTALLRNGWYTENYTMGADAAIAHGVLLGSTGAGRISAASRADYAQAAAAVLAGGDAGTFELAGDAAFTLADFAAALSAASGKPVAYRDLPEQAYREALEGVGLPGPLAAMLADSSAKAAGDALFDTSGTLATLIGRPTTPMRDTVAAAVRA